MTKQTKQSIPSKYLKINADMLTPIGIFQRLHGSKRFLLESSHPHEKKGKFSFIGVNPYEEVIGHGGKTILKSNKDKTSIEINEGALHFLNQHMPKISLDIDLPFVGGAVGYVGYDAIRQFEDIGKELIDTLKMPDIHFMLYQDLFVFDHKQETVYCIAMNPFNESESTLDKRLENLKQTLSNKALDFQDITQEPFKPDMTRESFEENVKIAKEHIHNGDVFQVVLSQRMQANFTGDTFSFYRKLRKSNPSPYMFYVDFEDYVVLGASPESLLQTKGNQVVTNPIAGTRPRGKTTQEDLQLEQELLADEKEISEHRMLIDLGRNDLGRISEIGSIEIPTLMKVEKYEHVMHIVSEVSGILLEGKSSIDALISCLPAGTVSGAPKIRAMQIINELEEKKRGVYSGGIGYIGFNRDLNMALTIRSLIAKDSTAYIQAGAGIVFDSVPIKEYEETLHKARSLMEVQNIDFIN